MALNGGPLFTFTGAFSFSIHCHTQKVNDCGMKRTAEAKNREAAGCKTNEDLSWQAVPASLAELLADKDASKQTRAIAAMLQMKKIDSAGFERAAQESRSKAVTTKDGSKPPGNWTVNAANFLR
jgi:predicted 3-demethylubiquinone-9 3-methyltransferase (glyoxalase superfamily)